MGQSTTPFPAAAIAPNPAPGWSISADRCQVDDFGISDWLGIQISICQTGPCLWVRVTTPFPVGAIAPDQLQECPISADHLQEGEFLESGWLGVQTLLRGTRSGLLFRVVATTHGGAIAAAEVPGG
ncbi:hypothetical protein H920_16691 [Fukomys damarensis]|uniref:Uncharacterized protein n=1 Tax=Fukomys damarensis TaxID=885580 RepID=A0A091CRQ1_FUKDA|nr:hypothetical protein H920_16691 [Fukomys damarensis]